jgi:hypothetical protein
MLMNILELEEDVEEEQQEKEDGIDIPELFLSLLLFLRFGDLLCPPVRGMPF